MPQCHFFDFNTISNYRCDIHEYRDIDIIDIRDTYVQFRQDRKTYLFAGHSKCWRIKGVYVIALC